MARWRVRRADENNGLAKHKAESVTDLRIVTFPFDHDMSDEKPFSEEQKQYLSGFAFGVDVARAVSGLPVISGGQNGGVPGQSFTIGDNAESALPIGPEKIALQAQKEVVDGGAELCKEELAKQAKNPLDMWDEMQTRSDAGEFPKGTDVFLQKFHGLFYVAPAQDSYMCRMRLPGGILQAWQMRGLADLSDRSAGGFLDVTTRANLQYREIPADQAMNVLYGLRDLDIINLGSGGDNIRNCTASPLSGIDTDELIETIPLARRMHHYILNHREMYGLPRKFNIAFDGGGTVSALDDTNDIGFHAVRVDAEHADETTPEGVYFQLTLGGITGHKDFARPTGVLLRADQCVEVAGAIVRVFVQSGNRTDRKKARLKYVLDDWGFDKYLEAVEAELGWTLPRVDQIRLTLPTSEDRLAHIGVHPQRQKGRIYIGVVLPVGRITSKQARGLSDIAEEFGNGEIRLTVWQNLVLPHIRESDVEDVAQRLLDIGLDYQASNIRSGLVACTGSGGCKFAASETKTHAMELAGVLESELELDQPINIHLTGCHHSCAQHYIGDIGLLGCKVDKDDDLVDGYHVHLGGGWGERQGIARLVFESVAFEDLPQLLVGVITAYQQNRESDESFVQFTGRHDDDQLRKMSQVQLAAK